VIRQVARAFVGEAELTERQGAMLVASAGLAFSFSAIAFRGVEAASNWQFLAYRGASTTVAMLILIAVRRRSRPVVFRGTTWKTALAALVLSSAGMLYILALARTSAATTLFLVSVAPVFAAIFGWLLLREAVHRKTYISIGITAIGVTIMVGDGLDAGSGIGVLLASILPIQVGLYNVLMRSQALGDPVVPALMAGIFLGIGAGLVAFIETGLAVSWRDALMATISGGFALGIGLPMFNLGHRSVTAARVSLLLMTEIVLAPLWVWIWPGETPRLGTLVGGAIVLGSVVWLVTQTSDRRDLLIA
jgi:DME family drug/metabolite transporter